MGVIILFLLDPLVKVNGKYYDNILLSQQMFPAIKSVAGDVFHLDIVLVHLAQDIFHLLDPQLHHS